MRLVPMRSADRWPGGTVAPNLAGGVRRRTWRCAALWAGSTAGCWCWTAVGAVYRPLALPLP
ncbi:hypothetical protein ACFQQB_59750 [Nonomuraea rubra]|uniref:hypothetical protein n=1 Tax=Nonomuraea rubra TaxID=46180 RepID=UPI00361D209C